MNDLSSDSDGLVIAASDEAKRVDNKIRRIVDGRKMPTNPSKELLNVTVGTLMSYNFKGNFDSMLYECRVIYLRDALMGCASQCTCIVCQVIIDMSVPCQDRIKFVLTFSKSNPL